jgi:predicted RNA-binding protein with PIN domain
MPYLIDGHNLIPKIPGLTLQAIDDEIQLVLLLQEFCRLERKGAEVFFDNAPPGQGRARRYGMVTARFVRQGMTADLAIGNRLKKLGGAARNWTVVSSDHQVQNFARAARAHYISSEDFAVRLSQTLQAGAKNTEETYESDLDPEELDYWMRLFGGDRPGSIKKHKSD